MTLGVDYAKATRGRYSMHAMVGSIRCNSPATTIIEHLSLELAFFFSAACHLLAAYWR